MIRSIDPMIRTLTLTYVVVLKTPIDYYHPSRIIDSIHTRSE
jgi:hypothetical protein